MKIRYLLSLAPILLLGPLFILAPDLPKNGTFIAGFGDPQYGSDTQKENKKGHIACILRLIQECKKQAAANAQPADTAPKTATANTAPNPELADRTYAVAVPGDINQGTTGHSQYHKWFWLLKYIPYVNKDKAQTEEFKKECLKPLEKENVTVLLGAGNHDYWDISQAALDLIKDRHGRMYYAKHVGSVVYIYCGVYPDKKIVSWLKDTIAAEQAKDANTSFVVACHYNILGNHYEWWHKEERDNLMDAIRGKNVQLIMTGHDHQTYKGEANDIPVVCTGGDILPISLFDATGKYQKTIYYKAHQNADGSFSPEEVNPDQIPTLSMLTRASTKEEDSLCAERQEPINQQY